MLSSKCDFCNGNHNSRNCVIEKTLAPYIKFLIGHKIEYFICKNIKCPCCNNKSLHVLGDFSPSLDSICMNCNRKFEIKSKCLSCKDLPNDLHLNHGNYKYYLQRQKIQLDFIVLIYSVNRRKKEIQVRKVFYIPDKMIKDLNQNYVRIIRNNKNSTILISNHNVFVENKSIVNYKINMQDDVNDLFKKIEINNI